MVWHLNPNSLFLLFVVALASWILSMNNFGPFRSHVNDCKMTYMWRYMNFMDTGFRYGNKYSLILYGEGFYAKDFMQTKKVNGIPVLFVPGNAGSARQVRSLGSVLQNKTEMQNTKFHFDVFAVDFNEELSGLSSEYISTQADYLSKAVDYIWKMYDKPPNGIIFVGHSMGGIAIRLLISDPGFDLNKAAMVLTFATPHRMPPLPIDHKMIQMWKKIHEAWKTDRILNSHIRIISVSGGFKDELIDEIWTLDKNVTHVSTTEIDKVWLEADHQCIVWCNQLVRQTSRLLFDYARNPKNFFQKPQIYLDRHYKESGLRLKKIAPKNETKFLSADSCEPKCPPDGFLKIFVDEKLENKKLLVLSPLTYEPEQLIQIIDSNATERKCRPTTRFLKEDTFYSFINLQDCSGNTILVNLEKKLAWLVDNSDVYLPSFKVTWEKEITNLIWPLSNFRFNVDGVKILNISFYNNDLVARLDIIRDIEIEENDRHRAIWSTESVQRMDNPFAKNDRYLLLYFLKSNKTFDIMGDPNRFINDGQIIFISFKNCTYDVTLYIDYPKTLFRITRYYFDLIIEYLLVFTLVYTMADLYTDYRGSIQNWNLLFPIFLIGRAPLGLIWISIVLYILWNVMTFIVFVIWKLFEPFKKWLPSNLKLLNIFFYAFIGLGLLIFSYCVHSFPIAIIIGITTILHLRNYIDKAPNTVKRLSNYLVLLVLLQAPAGFVYFANVVKYHELISTSDDLNRMTVMILLIFTYARLFDLRKVFMHFLVLFLFIIYLYSLYLFVTSDLFSMGGFFAFDMLCRVFTFFWILLYYLLVILFD